MDDRSAVRHIGALVGALLLAAAAGSAEEAGRGSLLGVVRDPAQVALAGVTVEARPADGGATVRAVSGATGEYRIEGLGAGTWTVTFRLPGFASSVVHDVVVRPGTETRRDATLRLRLTTQVIVTARATFRDLSSASSGEELLGIASTASSGVVAASEIEDRPVARPGDLAERVPGVIVSQHSGEGKANQYYVRGFNIDHGTDLALSVAGMPVNLPTNGHGQGYADLNFLIPELVGGIQYKKGTSFADEGDFSAAGAVHVNYLNVLDRPIAKAEIGQDGFGRVLLAASPGLGPGHLLAAFELERNDGPWVRPDDFRKVNGVLRYSQGSARSGFSVTGLFYDATWSSTDQVPQRAIEDGTISRFGHVDPTDGGRSHRHSLIAAWQRGTARSVTRVEGFMSEYGLDLFSNFTYVLDDPENGDQFEQRDDRWLGGVTASRLWVIGGTARPTELTIGTQLRFDDVAPVGLYRTAGRARLSTVRQDDVRQASAAAYVQADTQWAPKVRTVVGLRGDAYRFDVDASDPRNSGKETATRPSPKLSLAFGPWSRTELYASYGRGFHSNDARGATFTVDPSTSAPAERVDPLVRARGAELGLRTLAVSGLHATAALWQLDLDSELLFVGDAGTTEASRPSRRRGVELTADYSPRDWLKLDASYAFSKARFTDDDPAGDRIPGAIEGVFAAGAALHDAGRWSGSLRVRWFGPRPLVEDDSVRSKASTLVNADVSLRLRPGWSLQASVFNLLDAKVSDIDYFYTSRLPGEPAAGVDDVHTHPSPPRTFRIGLVASF
ncbi:MAG: TonB-dependent receptor [Vicinamibacteria bacterium]